jgi:hypothetical protein
MLYLDEQYDDYGSEVITDSVGCYCKLMFVCSECKKTYY